MALVTAAAYPTTPMTNSIGPGDEPVAVTSVPVVAGVFVVEPAESFGPTVRTLAANGLAIVLGAPTAQVAEQLAESGYDTVLVGGADALVAKIWHRFNSHVLLVSDAVITPPGLLDTVAAWIESDLRIATVSFPSNVAGIVSFPQLGVETQVPVSGHDEQSLTRLLRTAAPRARPAVLPCSAGPVVLFTAWALSAVGPPEPAPHGSPASVCADFSLRARRRGFVDLVDTSTFVACPSDLRTGSTYALAPDEQDWLYKRHPFAAGFVDLQMTEESVATRALRVAASKVVGLRVLIDGSCLGAHQMGTQVSTIHLIDALAERDDVAEIGVALVQPIPDYAAATLSRYKVRPRRVDMNDLAAMGRFDVVHRPFQPGMDFAIAPYRAAADRVVVSILDLIAYHVGAYLRDRDEWRLYRRSIEQAVSVVDGVSVISHDVAEQVRLHQLPIGDDRLFVSHLGTEHLTGAERFEVPGELVARGFGAEEFLLCLGTNYTHKNRDLAVRSFKALRDRGRALTLVLAGPSVPFGSTRLAESREGDVDGAMYVLPDVVEAERNWLLRHAALVLYPTSAEGFGLVPFEAACFGTPTVYVGFGPLDELATDAVVTAATWDPASIADAAEKLLNDPQLARQQVDAVLAAGEPYTWSATAETLVEVYRRLLAMPARTYVPS